MTLPGARQRLKDNKEATVRNYEIVNKLKSDKEELWLLNIIGWTKGINNDVINETHGNSRPRNVINGR